MQNKVLKTYIAKGVITMNNAMGNETNETAINHPF